MRGDAIGWLLSNHARQISHAHHGLVIFQQVLGALEFEHRDRFLGPLALDGFARGVLFGTEALPTRGLKVCFRPAPLPKHAGDAQKNN